jgi:hypothetical protein
MVSVNKIPKIAENAYPAATDGIEEERPISRPKSERLAKMIIQPNMWAAPAKNN